MIIEWRDFLLPATFRYMQYEVALHWRLRPARGTINVGSLIYAFIVWDI